MGMNCKKMIAGYAVMMMVSGVATTVADGAYVSCEAHHECDKNEYCYKQSGRCVPCTDCKVYNRQKPASYPNCPKMPRECGKCVPGYQEEIFTEGNVRDHCIPTASPQDKNGSYVPWTISVGIILALICIIIFLFVRRFWKKEPVESIQEDTDLEDLSPPPYSVSRLPYSGAPLLETHAAATTTSDFVSEICETSLEFQVKEEDEPLQQAVPFRDPYLPYQNCEEQEGVSGDNPPAVQDEETLESVWAPPPGYGQQASACNADDSNEASNSEVAVSSQTASVANTPDSGLSDYSRGTSSSSLPQRPFEGLGTSSSSNLSFQQPLATTGTRRHSDEDVSIEHSHKRARRDSGTQSLDEDTQPVNVIVINVQQIYSDS